MKKSNEIICNKKDILTVTPRFLKTLKNGALAAVRKRFRLCMHHSHQDPTQEMLIVAHRNTYIPPHRHPQGKSESYHVVEGSMSVCIFNDSGKIIRIIKMGCFGHNKPFIFRVANSKWHMPVPTSEWVVYHETYSGPFEKTHDVRFPAWSPVEGDTKQVKIFLRKIRAAIKKSKSD